MPVERVKVGNEGYINFLKIVRENKEESSITATTLKDLIPDFQGDVNSCELAKFKLYSHQVRAFEALKNGKNVILASSTGSGKTEAWFIYLLYLIYTRGKARALVIYPTVALGKDQETRLSGYFEKCVDTISMNGPVRYDGEYDRNYDSLDYAKNASIVITNPEKIARNLHSRVRLAPFNNIDFIVLDEFDFYSSAQALKLLTLLK
ncbi:MAG: DEAD/DEAH box helicase, partial [Thermoplasmatales archaeon]